MRSSQTHRSLRGPHLSSRMSSSCSNRSMRRRTEATSFRWLCPRAPTSLKQWQWRRRTLSRPTSTRRPWLAGSSIPEPLMLRRWRCRPMTDQMSVETAPLDEQINKPRITRKTKTEKTAWFVLAAVVILIVYTLVSNPNFEWPTVARYFFGFPILKGLLLTIILTFVSMALGTLIGLVLAVFKIMDIRPITVLVDFYLTFFRGTPILVQLIFWFNIA